MPSTNINKIFGLYWLLCLSFFIDMAAQPASALPVEIAIQESQSNEHLVSHILKISNRSDSVFNGFIRLNPLPDIRSLSPINRRFSIAPGDSCFIAYKLLIGKSAGAGRKNVVYHFYDETNHLLSDKEIVLDIKEREQINLWVDDIPVMITNREDSVRVRAVVNNRGNKEEEVTLVFNIPDLHGAPSFIELKAKVKPMEQRPFVCSFMASGNLLSSEQFSVYVTAMKGKEKTLFGSKTMTVQNVSSGKTYTNTDPNATLLSGYGSDNNSITLSYRQFDSFSSMLQASGGGYVNLPAGYLHLKGNIYRYSSQPTPMVTNTSLEYKLYENEFTVGNVSESMELSLYGRGAKALFSNEEKSKTLTVGAIDQNFDLLNKASWFTDYYSFYAKGMLGANNYAKGMEASYVYQKNPYEKAQYNMAGTRWRRGFGKEWTVDVKLYGSLTGYEQRIKNRWSGASELTYRGTLFSDLQLNGSGYYSDAYFPGNRKGTTSVSQGFSKKLLEGVALSTHFSYVKTEPKSDLYAYTYRSKNEYGGANFSLPKMGRWSPALYYQYRGEQSTSYASLSNSALVKGELGMTSHRTGAQLQWSNHNARHSLYTTFEAGFSSDPLREERQAQAKATFSYSYNRWLTLNTSFQKGSFFLYEYMMARQENTTFERSSIAFSMRKELSKKIMASSNLNYSHDVYQGGVPSANVMLKYYPTKMLSLFTNGYWYEHRFLNTKSTVVYNVEVGLTFNFSRTQPSSKKKSTIIAQLYYDQNANNVYDEGDEPVKDYIVRLSNKAFITDKDGKIKYSLTPYGDYTLQPVSTSTWSFRSVKIKAEQSKTRLEIPLKQSGAMRGAVTYKTEKHSVDIVPRYEGIRFFITSADKTVSQTVITDNEGKFLTFLPVGDYMVTLDTKTLPEYTDCKSFMQTSKVATGGATELKFFEIEVKTRQVNIKRFTQ